MSTAAAELIALLERQTAAARELIAVLQRDRECVVRHRIEELEQSNGHKETLVLQMQALERERQARTAALADELGIDPAGVRISALTPKLGAEGDALERAAGNLRAAVSSLREIIAVSHGFLEQSILGIRSVLGLIGSLRAPPQQTYDAAGRISATLPEGRTLRREA